MRSWHKDELTIIAREQTGTDTYGLPVFSEHELSILGRVTSTGASLDGDRPVEEFDIRLPAGTAIGINDSIRFTLPGGGPATGTVTAPAVHHRSPHGAASSTVVHIKVVDSHGR